jgi:hypothetical protein
MTEATKLKRAPRKPSNKITKADVAAYEAKIAHETTEANEIVAEMAMELTEADMSVIDTLDAIESVQAEAVTEIVLEAQAITDDGETFEQVMANVDDDMVDKAVFAVAKAIDDRAAYEEKHGHPNIQRVLKSVRTAFVSKSATRAMLAAGFDEADINRSVHDGKRYNVYALGKLADAIKALSGGQINNAINNACMRSLFKFNKANVAFTMDMAKAACSAQIRVDAAVKGLLIRHTVSPSTAPTQASSTMQALVSLGVVTSSGGGRNPTFTVTEAPAAKKLMAMLSTEGEEVQAQAA